MPVNLNEDRAYAAAISQQTQLQAEVARLRQTISDLQARLETANNGDSLDEEALALVSGSDAVESASLIRTQLVEMRHRLAVSERALTLQRKIVEQERSRVSRAIAESKRPEYETLIRGFAKAVRALKAAIESEAAFREELISGDVSFAATIRPMGLPKQFDASTGEDCDRWLSEAAEHYAI